MNLREIACKKLTEKLLEDCAEEYRRMYRNASFRGEWPDYDSMNEKETRWYYDSLSDMISDFIKDLEAEVKETHGFDWCIFQYGCSGATIAMEKFSWGSYGSFNPTLDDTFIIREEDYQDPETYDPEDCGDSWVGAYEEVKNHLAAFKLINERVRAAATINLAEWWKEMKEANEWTFGDEDEDQDDEDENLLAEAAG